MKGNLSGTKKKIEGQTKSKKPGKKMKLLSRTYSILFVSVVLFSISCSNGDTDSSDDTAANLLYSAYGASFTAVPSGGCTDSAVPTISVGTTSLSGTSYYYYFYLFTGTGATNTFAVSFSSGEADLWIGSEGAYLIPSDFSQVESRSEAVGGDSLSVATTSGTVRCLVVPVTDAGTFTLTVN